MPAGALLALLLLLLAGGAQAFPGAPRALSAVGLSGTAALPRFGGFGSNGTGLGFQRMVRIDGALLLAARDHIFAFELGTTGPLRPQRHLTWEPRDRGSCALRGRQQDECHNYIRVLVPRDARTLLACGTNAFSPVCRTIQVSSLAQEGEELSGQARCPFDAKQSVVALFVDNSLYSATVADFQASDPVIYRSLSPGRPPLRTLKYSSRWLQEPHFVQALPYGPHVYFFFREVAVELSALGKVLVARVARVCRNDRGGSPRVLERRWTSFLKVRLHCSIPGDTVFYFDVLEAVTPPCTLHGHPAVLALFGTQPNSIPGSAVCAFYLADVERAFEGAFAEARGAVWAPVPEERVPRPRPGCCAGMASAAAIATSAEFPDETLAFAKEHPLLHRALAPAGRRPLFTHPGARLTQLAVDVDVGPGGNRTVLFLGAEDGRVLKVLVDTRPPEGPRPPSATAAPRDSQEPGDPGDTGDTGSKTLLLEEISLFDPGRCRGPRDASRVLGLELHPPGQELYVAFAGCLVRLPLSRCAQHSTCRRSCLAARDPYCVWLPPRGCVPFSRDLPSGFEQDVEGALGITESCRDASAEGDSDRDGDLAHGVCQAGPGPAVPVPVLVGCVLGAFALGAVATGLLAAICRPSAPKGAPEPPAAAIPQPPAPPPAPRLYPTLPGPGGLPDPPPPPATPEATPQRGLAPRLGTPEPPGPGPPAKAALEELLQRLHGSGGSGWPLTPPVTSSFANRVQPGAGVPAAPRDGAPRRFDVPPDSPPPPRRPLAQRHSLGGPAGPPGTARPLTRMHSLGGPPWGPRPPAMERAFAPKPSMLPKPLLPPAAPGRP
ncbi:semaphorin-6C [Cuculus canorus]|uniref:semaphorin-6C n=1 Tax=Cuculus canorus TaxID=55661 RepID=UPI0023AA794A|nr:semaphorin-6C [Cuculus canorus]